MQFFMIVIVAGLIAGFVSGGILFFAIKREVEEIRGDLAARIPDPSVRRAQLRPISLRIKLVCGAVGLTAIPTIVALVFFCSKMSDGTEDFAIRWQNNVLDALVVRLDAQPLSSATASVIGVKSALAAPLDVTLLDFSAPNPAGHGLLDAELVAKRAAMSTRSLTRAFHAETGLSLKGWVHHARMLQAMELLVDPRASVTDVALACGYSSLPTFSRRFAAFSGESPRAYRARAAHD